MKTCFVICPLGEPKSQTRARADAVLSRIVQPVLTVLGYEVKRADLTTDQSTIPESISKHIFEDDLIIADLSACNPNVFYELGKRHAWGGRCIHLTDDISKLPFDVRHHRVIGYDLGDAEGLDNVRTELRRNVTAVEQIPIQCPFPLTPEKLIELSGATVLIGTVDGRRDHYYLAERIAKTECKTLFLMQRSSSLILGPEQGWGAEESFYRAMIKKIEEGTQLYHIVSLEGISRHLARPESIFPDMSTALSHLSRTDKAVGIKGVSDTWYFKRIPQEEEEKDLKPDRQARTFLVELANGEAEGVIVIDLGGKQSCFHLRGPLIRTFFQTCIDFYHRCPLLTWADLEATLSLTSRSTRTRAKPARAR